MAEKKKTASAKREWCVIAVRESGLDRTVQVFGPYTRTEAATIAHFHSDDTGERCSIEHLGAHHYGTAMLGDR